MSLADNVSRERPSTAQLYAGAPLLSQYCAQVNARYMLCKERNANPEACLEHANEVKQCTISFFDAVQRSTCSEPFAALSTCLDRANNYDFMQCAKQKDALFKCAAAPNADIVPK